MLLFVQVFVKIYLTILKPITTHADLDKARGHRFRLNPFRSICQRCNRSLLPSCRCSRWTNLAHSLTDGSGRSIQYCTGRRDNCPPRRARHLFGCAPDGLHRNRKPCHQSLLSVDDPWQRARLIRVHTRPPHCWHDGSRSGFLPWYYRRNWTSTPCTG